MGVAEWSRDHVEDLLADLEQRYSTFPVDQTTVTLPRDDYRRVADRCQQSVARVDVRVQNDDGDVLMVETDGELTLPGRPLDNRDAIEREAQVAVHQTAGIECAIEGLDHATIAGVTNGDDTDSETVYRLLVMLTANALEGSPSQNCQWQQEDPPVEVVR
jgi:L-aminopeptidase/D-esterase-like protein